jgi:hypothetical protein
VLTDFLSDIHGGYNVLDEEVLDNRQDLITIEIRQEEALFAMQFDHQPNGNIEQMKWKVNNRATSIYDFVYDPLDRVKEANYGLEYYLEEQISPPGGDTYISTHFRKPPS